MNKMGLWFIRRLGHLHLNAYIFLNGLVWKAQRTQFYSKKFPNGPRRIFSGIQPTGTLHLGNYFGAVQKWVELQNSGEDALYSIVDLHSITLPQDPKMLHHNILEMTASLLACGIDPDKSILFQQSSVHQHSELYWILSCITTMARLGHLPQFKEKSESLKEVPLGLYVYPVLQAADILLYRSTHIPVGEDQVQHLQLAQQIVKTFNHRFGSTFPSPQVIIADANVSRLRSLRNPEKKMSKSEPDPRSRIVLTDPPEAILEKCKKAVTDFTSEVTYDPEKRPGVSNLITIHCLLSNLEPAQVCQDCAGLDTARYKLRVAEVIEDKLSPIRKKIEELMAEPGYLTEVLNKGAEKARNIAESTLQDVKVKIGLKL